MVLSLSLVLTTFTTVDVLINSSLLAVVTVSFVAEVVLVLITSLVTESSVHVVNLVVVAVVTVVVVTVDVSV